MNRSTPQLPCDTSVRPSSDRETASGTEPLTPLTPAWTGRLELVASEAVAVTVLDERTSEWVCTDRITILRTYV